MGLRAPSPGGALTGPLTLAADPVNPAGRGDEGLRRRPQAERYRIVL